MQWKKTDLKDTYYYIIIKKSTYLSDTVTWNAAGDFTQSMRYRHITYSLEGNSELVTSGPEN